MGDPEQQKSPIFPDRAGNMASPALAALIISAWIVSLWYAFFQMRTGIFPDSPAALALMLWIQFLFCGLFIVTHDACHGTAYPGNARGNRCLGRIAAALYAAFDFDRLVPKHQAHHIHVTTSRDPDFHEDTANGANFFLWGWRFFREYLQLRQIVLMMAVAQIFFHGLKVPERNVIQFWVLPALLSGLQLFFFGTWLPHRHSRLRPFADHHNARDSQFPWLISLISCWHFGYHHTHHLLPGIPWHQLPANRRKL